MHQLILRWVTHSAIQNKNCRCWCDFFTVGTTLSSPKANSAKEQLPMIPRKENTNKHSQPRICCWLFRNRPKMERVKVVGLRLDLRIWLRGSLCKSQGITGAVVSLCNVREQDFCKIDVHCPIRDSSVDHFVSFSVQDLSESGKEDVANEYNIE